MHTTTRQGQRAHATRRKCQNAEIEVNGAGLQGHYSNTTGGREDKSTWTGD